MPPTTVAKGAAIPAAYPIGTLIFDPYHLESSKCWGRNFTDTPNLTPNPPGTSSYMQKHVAI